MLGESFYPENKDLPAYPLNGVKYQDELGRGVAFADYKGLTKREMFAMAAMQGLCANSNPGSHHSFQNLCAEAIAYADELLKQLE